MLHFLPFVTIMSSVHPVSSGGRHHALSKRQTFNQPSYQFSLTSCSPGTSVGTVSAASSGNLLGYTLDPSSVYGMYVRVDYLTGQITLTTTPVAATTFTFYVVAATSSRAVSVPVTVSCTGTSSSFTNGQIICPAGNVPCNFINSNLISTGGTSTTTGQFGQSSYTFTATNCAAGSTVGTVSANGATSYVIASGNTGQYYITSSGAIVTNNQLTTGTTSTFYVTAYSAQGASAAVPVTIAASCTSGTGTGSQSSYAFASSTCTAGALVGTVTIPNTSTYQLDYSSTSLFAISNTGQISVNNAPTSGVNSVIVYPNGDLSRGVPVTITLTCNSGTGGGSTGVTTNLPVFGQSFYAFSVTSCTATSTVGAVTASNAVSYLINQGSNYFTISNTGSISTVGTLSSGVYPLTVVATSSTGSQKAIPVTVYVTCNG